MQKARQQPQENFSSKPEDVSLENNNLCKISSPKSSSHRTSSQSYNARVWGANVASVVIRIIHPHVHIVPLVVFLTRLTANCPLNLKKLHCVLRIYYAKELKLKTKAILMMGFETRRGHVTLS